MQPIFSRNADYTKIAFLNWRIQNGDDIRNLLNIAEGYLESALSLAKVSLEDNEDKKADILIFPILANANHGIELYLKAIIWIMNKLLDNGKNLERGHNIQQLFQTARARISDYNGQLSVKAFNEATVELEDYIEELYNKIKAAPGDDKMDFSRYPMSRNQGNHFYVDVIGNVEVDLENFANRFQIIKEQLVLMSDFLKYNMLDQDW